MIATNIPVPRLLAIFDGLASLGRAVRERQEQKTACSVNFGEEPLQAANRQDPKEEESHHAEL
jgi:hypothetical protein